MTSSPLPRKSRQPFPNLTDNNHSVTSQVTDDYNCIAWAFEVTDRWMWPGSPDAFWPSEVTNNDELEAVVQLYMASGYEKCGNSELEEGYKKVAIYVKEIIPSHAALQLESGRWSSKLGRAQDIQHDTLECLEGDLYGTASVFLRKRRP